MIEIETAVSGMCVSQTIGLAATWASWSSCMCWVRWEQRSMTPHKQSTLSYGASWISRMPEVFRGWVPLPYKAVLTFTPCLLLGFGCEGS